MRMNTSGFIPRRRVGGLRLVNQRSYRRNMGKLCGRRGNRRTSEATSDETRISRIDTNLKVLLTGASGFVGSHIVESLRARNIATAVLLRPSSDRRFVQSQMGEVEERSGSIADVKSLNQALVGVSHVIHCAGCTKVRRRSEFYEVNHLGTQNVVEAVNARRGEVQRLLHVSSLAVNG